MGVGCHGIVPGAALRRRRPMWLPPEQLTKGTAQNVIFILMAGAPSHTDTFDLKDGQRRDAAAASTRPPSTACYFPTGLMPKLATLAGDFAIARSVQSHARGPLAEPDLGADRTQSAGGAGQYRAEYRQHRGGEKDGERKPSAHLPHVSGAEFQWRGEPGLSVGASTRRSRCTPSAGGISQHHQSDRPDALREPLQAAATRWTQPAHQRVPTAAEMSDYNEF